MAPTGEEASEWKMKHTWISLFFKEKKKKKLKPLPLIVSGKTKQGIEG